MINHFHLTNENPFHFLKDNLWKSSRLLTTNHLVMWRKKSDKDNSPHNTKEKGLSLDPRRLPSRQRGNLFFQPTCIQILVFSSNITAGYIQWTKFLSVFNLSRALCNCMYRLWVSFSHFITGLFMLRNLWGITRGLQPGKCECRKELSQRKISAQYSCICIWRLLVTSIFWLCLCFQNIKGSTWKGNVQTKLLNINKLDT